MQALQSLQLNCSDPLHVPGDCIKYSEITVGKRTQWKPAVLAVKRFAVYSILKPHVFINSQELVPSSYER